MIAFNGRKRSLSLYKSASTQPNKGTCAISIATARTANTDIRPCDYIFLDTEDVGKKKTKLRGREAGPYRLPEKSNRTFEIYQGGDVERGKSDRATRAPTPPDVGPKDPY